MSYFTGIVAGAMLFVEADSNFRPLSSFERGAAVAFMPAGAAVGAICGFLAADAGRRPALLAAAICYIAGGAVMALSTGIGFLSLGRSLAGLGAGMSSSLASLYVSEIVPSGLQGQLEGWPPMMGACGLVASFAVSALLGLVLPGGGWRLQIALGVVPACVVLLLCRLLPESPRWLMLRGRREDAERSLTALFPGFSADAVAGELDDVARQLQACPETSWPIIALLASSWRQCGAAVAVNVLQQATGINIVLYYGPYMLRTAGFSTPTALLAALALGAGQLATVLANAPFVQNFGLRLTTLSGALVAMLGLSLTAAGFWWRDINGVVGSVSPPWMVVAGMFLFRAAFSFSLGPLPHIVASDVLSPEAKGFGSAAAWGASWLANAALCLGFPLAEERLTRQLGSGSSASAAVFAAFLAATAACSALAWRWLPEASGRHPDWRPEQPPPDMSAPKG